MLVYIALYVQICQISLMGRIVVELDEELEKTFRDEVAKRLGMKKGNIKTAIEQAITMWIGLNT